MTFKQIPAYLIAAIANWLSNTRNTINDKNVCTNIGVPQGGILSPTLFNIYIDSLVEDLNYGNNTALAYADDIVMVTRGKVDDLRTSIHRIEKWSRDNHIQVNLKKSAIFELKVDRRTRNTLPEIFMGFPTLAEYKYLGILFNDCGNMKANAKSLQM